MPPSDMWIRLGAEFGPYLDFAQPGEREAALGESRLLKLLAARDLDSLHRRLMAQAMPWHSRKLTADAMETTVPGEVARVLERAEEVMQGKVCLMGSGIIQIGRPDEINWYKDYKSGLEWPFGYFHKLDTADLDRPSDVKFPWELSRMQWLLPVAQAWRLTGDDRYASHLRIVLENWMECNPCAWGINWSCTMEPAMRVFTWCWIYQMTADAPSWQDRSFRFHFLQGLYLHLEFIRRYLEITDINGNHLTADTTALIVGGTLFGKGRACKWKNQSWRILKREIQLQVYSDGVDFEGSVPYHRLVAELFHIAAVAVKVSGGSVPVLYQKILLKMAEYTEAYMRPDGVAPIIGDNDDARTLPLGGQAIGDHRYLPALIRWHWLPQTLSEAWLDNSAEVLWWTGVVPEVFQDREPVRSCRFSEGGSYILRSKDDYVFIDCGPVGLAGRGGHGHNDMLSFEAVLNGSSLISDPGCLVYTGDWQLRNNFRSTVAHNTPQIEKEEINRFISPRNLWFMQSDAKCEAFAWNEGERFIIVAGRHTGYHRMSPPVTIERSWILDKEHHALAYSDKIIGVERQAVSTTLQLAHGVHIEDANNEHIRLIVDGKVFILVWSNQNDWTLNYENAWVAPQYGVALSAQRISWKSIAGKVGGDSFLHLSVAIYPCDSSNELSDELFDKLLKCLNYKI